MCSVSHTYQLIMAVASQDQAQLPCVAFQLLVKVTALNPEVNCIYFGRGGKQISPVTALLLYGCSNSETAAAIL